jgi:hypothetical protein
MPGEYDAFQLSHKDWVYLGIIWAITLLRVGARTFSVVPMGLYSKS